MSYQDFTNNPDFRRHSNAMADSTLKILGRAFSAALMGIYNFIKDMVMMVFGK